MPMLSQADESLFGGSGPTLRNEQTAGVCTGFGEHLRQDFTIVIVADNADTAGSGAKVGQICRNRPCPATASLGFTDLEDRHRSFRADPQCIAVDIDIEHKIADQQHLW
jgi:hypothetical protein